MQAAIQYRKNILPSVQIGYVALAIVVGVMALALSASHTKPTMTNDVVPTTVTTGQQLNVSPPPAVEIHTGDASSPSVPLFSSEIMDSHESVQSLAALSKSNGNKAKPRQESSIAAESGLTLLDPSAPDQTH